MNYRYKSSIPTIHDSVFVAPNATIIGDVEIGEDASVWFNTVIRGDVNQIRIGGRTNVQDGAVLHVTFQQWALEVGNNVTVGHSAILHGCTIGDSCLIGMGCTILDGARIGDGSLVAAGSIVRADTRVPPNSLVAGVPAIIKRSLTRDEIERNRLSAERYVKYKNSYLSGDFESVS